MQTTIKDFWNSFLKVQLDLQFACKKGNTELILFFLNQLEEHTAIKENKLELVISTPEGKDKPVKLLFLTGGKKIKKRNAAYFVHEAPRLDNWKFSVGLNPYDPKEKPFGFYFPFIKEVVVLDQVFVHVHKIYKSTNKLHLHIYLDLNRPGVPKEELKPLASDILLYFLGEDLYYNHISMIKIVRRKLRKVNYLPLNELKNLIAYKSPF